MPRFAANISLLFADAPLIERVGRAARAGFAAVEVQFPYAEPIAAWQSELAHHQLPLVLHNLPPGDFAQGERGLACLPGREEEFRAGVQQAIRYANALGTPQLNCLCGIPPEGVDPTSLRPTVVANLRHAAAELKAAGIKLLVEPINQRDVPRFWLHSMRQALALLDEVGSDNLYIQYDLYHAQRTEGELAATLSAHLPRIAHLQIADNPGRHEPGSGEIHHPFLFEHIDRIGYNGWIGAEYLPAGKTEDGLAWLREASASSLR